MRTLVIDVGTSGLRAAIVHDDATVTDLYYEEFAPTTPFAGLVEFDATGMYEAVHRVSVAALASGPVTAVGITTQRASTIIWRASTGKPIGPSLGWQDLRTVGECITARAEHGFTFAPNQTATKAVWMLANYISDANERNSDDLRIGTVESWIVYNLTQGAQHVTDHTNAAVTGLTLPDGTAWNSKILSVLGIAEHQLPRIVDSMGFIGDATDLPGAPPILAIAGDQQASLVGQGCIVPGMAKITFGTGGMLDMFVGENPPSSAQRNSGGTFPIVAFSRGGKISYGTEAIMLSAGTNIDWLRDDMGLIANATESHTIASSVSTTDGVAYVPALLGLGTPFWDYGARGALFGITRGTTRAHIVRAVLEGVAHRGADLVDSAEKDSGLSIAEIRIDGGMSRNPTFVQALADATGRPVRVSPISEATTLGAGFMAGTESGQWHNLADAAKALSGAPVTSPLGAPGISRQQWSEAVSRSRSWIPELSSLDF
jgi:glycerol kinase